MELRASWYFRAFALVCTLVGVVAPVATGCGDNGKKTHMFAYVIRPSPEVPPFSSNTPTSIGPRHIDLRPAQAAPLVIALAVALALLGWSKPAAANPAEQCPATTKEAVAQLFDRWNAALATGRASEVSKLYAENAVLLSELSDRPRMGRADIGAYFQQFLSRHPQGSITMRSIMIGGNNASDIGTYVYRVTGQRKGTRMLIGGRYSTYYEYRNGDWLIAHHHISAMSKSLSPARLESRSASQLAR
jgi:uncharacterized protein (TIGR02246 family)